MLQDLPNMYEVPGLILNIKKQFLGCGTHISSANHRMWLEATELDSMGIKLPTVKPDLQDVPGIARMCEGQKHFEDLLSHSCGTLLFTGSSNN